MDQKLILISARQKHSISYDPFSCDWPTLCGRWQFACASENRERISYADDVVEMYVS